MEIINPMEPHDIAFYETRIRDWLPEHIIDAHTHAHVEILLVHFLVSLCLTYFAYFVCELIMCVNGVD